MALTSEEQKRIAAQESAWVDSAFGQVDLSAFPALNAVPEDRHDPRFAKDWRDTPFTASAQALKNFVSDPDTAALEETGNPEFVSELRERRGEAIAQQFKASRPDYLPTTANYEAMIETLAYNALPPSEQDGDLDEVADRLMDAGFFTLKNLQAVHDALQREGLLDVAAGSARELSGQERLYVIRLAQAGRADEAIEEYLRAALDEEPSVEMAVDPNYRDVCDRAVGFVWEAAVPDYSPTPERREFLRRYAAGRPLTIALLNSAWRTCQQNEAQHSRNEMLGMMQRQDETPPTDLDSLDDNSLDRLYHSTLGEYARNAKRRLGVLA